MKYHRHPGLQFNEQKENHRGGTPCARCLSVILVAPAYYNNINVIIMYTLQQSNTS
jgi:hypothetical protein